MKAILHADKNWGIGRDNGLMFRLPADMRFFKETTTGNVVVMGANTLRSFPKGPLPNRTNIVLSRTLEEGEGYIVVRSEEELFSLLENYPKESVYLIGGASLYRKFFPLCEEILLTKVDADGGADAFVENLDENADFVHELRDHIGHAFTVKDLKHLYRGGRLSRGAFVVGQAIKLNPILMVNERGALVHVGNVTGRKIAIRALLAKMEKESAGYKNDVIIVAHGDCIEDAELLAAKVREDYPESRVIITDVGPIIGSHCGKGMLALLYLAASKCDGRV